MTSHANGLVGELGEAVDGPQPLLLTAISPGYLSV
jgi:hypothetical protein